MRGWVGVLAAALLAAPSATASADEYVLTLAPERTSATFRLGTTLFAIDGALGGASGQIRFDPATGEASGQITTDLRLARTGNRLRDWEMHRRVLESDRYPLAVFRVSHVIGTVQPSGPSDLVLAGIVTVHGSEHALAVTLRLSPAGDAMSGESAFEVPFVAWGLRDPSLLFLRVAPVVTVSVKAQGELRQEADAGRPSGFGARAFQGRGVTRASR